jgi:hypothetical protein
MILYFTRILKILKILLRCFAATRYLCIGFSRLFTTVGFADDAGRLVLHNLEEVELD